MPKVFISKFHFCFCHHIYKSKDGKFEYLVHGAISNQRTDIIPIFPRTIKWNSSFPPFVLCPNLMAKRNSGDRHFFANGHLVAMSTDLYSSHNGWQSIVLFSEFMVFSTLRMDTIKMIAVLYWTVMVLKSDFLCISFQIPCLAPALWF